MIKLCGLCYRSDISRNNYCFAALHMASANGHATIITFLIDRGAVSLSDQHSGLNESHK